MAWRSGGSTNTELVNNLFRNGLIREEKVRDAMLNVDRAHFSPTSAYDDSPQVIGHGATISAPHRVHAEAASTLLPFLYPGARVLDIGSGSGYLVAVFAELVCPQPTDFSGKKGKVIGIEHIKELKELGQRNFGKGERGRGYLQRGEVQFVVGDGRKGWVDDEKEGWDAIHVGAAAVEVHPEMIEQLKNPGRIFIPVEDDRGDQYIWIVDKDNEGNVSRQKTLGVRYVPLTDAPR